jgi:hypothetical protein
VVATYLWRLRTIHFKRGGLNVSHFVTSRDGLTSEQRDLYGQAFEAFAAALNGMQNGGLDSAAAARRVIELAEQTPAPGLAPVGLDAEEMLRFVREKPSMIARGWIDPRTAEAVVLKATIRR